MCAPARLAATLSGMSETPLEDAPDLADLAHQSAREERVVQLTEHGELLAALLPASAYEDYRRLRDAEAARIVARRVADGSPRRVFTTVEEMHRAAGIA